MKSASDPALIGVVIYEGVEPIDIGGTVGVISMAQRILPGLGYVTIAPKSGAVKLASGLVVMADADFDHAPACDVVMVAGGPGWRQQTENPAMIAFLARQQPSQVASVCTGALILAASGQLRGRAATTRRQATGAETMSPLDLLKASGQSGDSRVAAVSDDRGTVTSGGVSLAIDGTLYLLAKLYGEAIGDRVAKMIEYDRAYAANQAALGHYRVA
jgi:transcriptional regulator GlxA family with amidase domain